METAQESFVPLNDLPKMKRSSSRGSDIDLTHMGKENTSEYRVHAVCPEDKGRMISLWHDISLYHLDPETRMETDLLNFVCEIPKFTRKKFEIATSESGNPIKQDEKKGVLREFKKGDIFFNYGCFPQTWEDPTYVHPDANCRGDNDPLDVCEIGARIIKSGVIRQVKVLGVLCMIDEGECDWKVVVIDADDKWAPYLNDIDDVEEQLPGTLDAIREWFRTYKIPDGKPPNVFGLEERFMDKYYAMQIVDECHHFWEQLITGEKFRQLDQHADVVKDLVRNLSRQSLFTLGVDLDEHKDVRRESFGDEESGALFF